MFRHGDQHSLELAAAHKRHLPDYARPFVSRFDGKHYLCIHDRPILTSPIDTGEEDCAICGPDIEEAKIRESGAWRNKTTRESLIPNRVPDRKPDGNCFSCSKPVPAGRIKYCDSRCSDEYVSRYHWQSMRMRVFKRDDFTCVICDFSSREKYGAYNDHLLQADHIVPIADGGAAMEIDNIRTLCVPCHKEVTADWHRDRAIQRMIDRGEHVVPIRAPQFNFLEAV